MRPAASAQALDLFFLLRFVAKKKEREDAALRLSVPSLTACLHYHLFVWSPQQGGLGRPADPSVPSDRDREGKVRTAGTAYARRRRRRVGGDPAVGSRVDVRRAFLNPSVLPGFTCRACQMTLDIQGLATTTARHGREPDPRNPPPAPPSPLTHCCRKPGDGRARLGRTAWRWSWSAPRRRTPSSRRTPSRARGA